MIVVLSGGTGGAKLIAGLSREVAPAELTIICNTADDFIHHGLNISPDLDTVMYTLAGLCDVNRGWGIHGDTFLALGQLKRLGAESWFKLGDRDLATHIRRSKLLRDGLKLSEVTKQLCGALGIGATVLPVSDDRIETRIDTDKGEISFQEFFVKERWRPKAKKVRYAGIRKSRPAPGVLEAIHSAKEIIVCPSNPVTSIGPILAVPGIRQALRLARGKSIAVSPFIGTSAISGPAHKLMAAMGRKPSSLGVAEGYAEIVDFFILDRQDSRQKKAIEALGIKTLATSILMRSADEKRKLAREVLAFLRK